MASKEHSEKPSSTTEQLKPTSVKDVKKSIEELNKGLPVKLPSGLVFRLRKPSLSKLIKENAIPSELVTAAIEMDSNTFEPTTRDEYMNYLRIIDEIVHRSCVQPKVVLDKDEINDESIHIDDVDDSDKISIYIYVQTGVRPYESFRKEQQNGDAGFDLPEVSGQKAK